MVRLARWDSVPSELREFAISLGNVGCLLKCQGFYSFGLSEFSFCFEQKPHRLQ